MNTITLTQIIKTNPEETKPLVVDADDISIYSRKGKTYVKKHYPVTREYIVKETEDKIKDMIENVYTKSQPPQYDFSRDLLIGIKVTDDRARDIMFKSDEYDYTYYTDDFLVIVKDGIIIRELSINKIIDIRYYNKEEK